MRVEDDQYQPGSQPGSAPDSAPSSEPVAPDGEPPASAAHPDWAPPEHYTPSGERRAEPPGPVANPDGAEGDHGTPADEAALGDVDGGEFPPEGTTYGEPVPPEPVVGVAQVPEQEDVPTQRTDLPDAEPTDERSGDTTPAATGTPTDTSEPAADTTPADTTPADTTPADTTPADTTAADTTPGDEDTAIDSASVAEPAADTAPEVDSAAVVPATESAPDAVNEPATEAGTAPVPDAEPGTVPGGTGPSDGTPVSVGPAAASAEASAPDELAPGEVPAETAAFWELEAVDGYRDRWQQLQLRFIDDPRQAAEQAQALVSDVLDGFTAAVSRQGEELNRWQSAEMDDTEELRMTVRRYRDLLDRLLSL